MGERKFCIKEVEDKSLYGDSTLIPESELDARLWEIIGYGKWDKKAIERAKRILLHGEGNGKCDTCHYKTGFPHDGSWCYMFEKKMAGCKKYLDNNSEEKETEAETHDEWVERMPRQMLYSEWFEWADAFCEWHREEPR